MKIRCVWEHHQNDTLLYASDLPGAFTRGENLDAALGKMDGEAASYFRWLKMPARENFELEIVQEKNSDLDIRDADSDVLFEDEKLPLSLPEYEHLKALALKSASDFLTLYEAIPTKDISCLPIRQTFYGQVPRTAREMYEHTKNVNDYYFGEIDVDADNEGSILDCRRRGFETLEQRQDFLTNGVCEGSYGEDWSVRKVLRRFLWHDRIHAKAMYRMAVKTFGPGSVPNVFGF